MTELEAVVLGLVWLRGPLTAYAVRRELGASPGAVYPLLRRLEKDGLLRGRAQSWGERGKTEYSVAPRGLEALRRGKDFVDAALAELDTRRKWLTQLARALDSPPRRRAT